MAQWTCDGRAEIVNLLKTGGYYAAGASLAQMAETIILDKKRLLPCPVYLTGQYRIDDLYIGLRRGAFRMIIEQVPVETQHLRNLSHRMLRPQLLNEASLLRRRQSKKVNAFFWRSIATAILPTRRSRCAIRSASLLDC